MPERPAGAKPLSSPVIVVVGPTAVGKSDLAQCIASKLGTCVLSADSMQVYRGMDIGTGKLPIDQRIVEHYGIDIIEPAQPYSAALFQAYGRNIIEQCDAVGKRCVVCGGTGFYVRALVDDYDFPAGEQIGNEVRDRYMALARESGPLPVWEHLKRVDPDSAALVEPNDVKRVVRALEMHSEGASYAQQREALASIKPYYPAVFIGLRVDPDILRSRIDARVDDMFAHGFVNEVEGLIQQGFADAITSRHAIGYEQVASYLAGDMTLSEAMEDTKVATHRYAKRQRTWFRKDERIAWFDANDAAEAGRCRLADQVMAHIEAQGALR